MRVGDKVELKVNKGTLKRKTLVSIFDIDRQSITNKYRIGIFEDDSYWVAEDELQILYINPLDKQMLDSLRTIKNYCDETLCTSCQMSNKDCDCLLSELFTEGDIKIVEDKNYVDMFLERE